ncbi:hypothetical protein JB92DRAFT_2845510 [Gautieria morchelliformis]|nr:hypothetical protein JB92DRAFT_2845510 [Gautieria morchelliformis]
MAPVPPLRSIMNTQSPGLHDHQLLELSSSTGMPSSPSVHAAHHQPLCSFTPIPGRHSKVKLTDFDAEYHATINLACRFYRVILCTEDPFPLGHDQDGYLREAWSLACKEHQVELGADSAAFNLIRQRGSQVRGESQMTTLAQTLTNKHTLVYRDHEARKGLFETPCLIHILQTQWFANPHDEGVAFHLYFNPIPLPTMALVFTAIDNCIDEWKDGQLKAVDFTEKSYHEKDGGDTAQGKHLLARMQQRLHDEARTHLGAGVLQEEGQLSGLMNDDFDEAAWEAAGDSEEEREAAHA